MIVVLYSTPYPFPISDYGFCALLRILDRLHGISRIHGIPFYLIRFSVRISRPFRFRFSLPSDFSFGRFLLLLTNIVIFILSCLLISLIFRFVLISL